MRLLVLGGTGGTGRELLRQALAAGHEVTAVVRSGNGLSIQAEQLAVVEGSVMDASLLDRVVPHHDAVISALGTRRGPRGVGSFRLMSQCLTGLLPAMERHNVRRLVVLSALGVGESTALSPALLRLAFQTIFRPVGEDKARSEEMVRRSGLDWTIVYPPILGGGPATGGYRHGWALGVGRLKRISRADVAQFLLRQVASQTYSRKSVIVST